MKAGAPWEHTLDADILSRGPAPYKRYLFWLLIFMVLGYLAAFPVVRSNGYSQWRASRWGAMLDFAFSPGNQNADIVIFGDSSAFIGIDPRILEQQLGMKALLLPNTIGSLPIVSDLPLRRYLATHARPRLLIFYFSPWNLDYNHAKKVRFFEGEEMILRHGNREEIRKFAWQHPTEALFFPFRFYNAYGKAIVYSIFRHPAPAPDLTASRGHMDDKDPFPKIAEPCTLPGKLFQDTSESSVQELADKYKAQVPELVYMAPVPRCSNVEAALHQSFSGLHAAPPVVLPPSDFVGDLYYAHIKPASVPVASRLLLEAVKQRLGSSPTDVPLRHP